MDFDLFALGIRIRTIRKDRKLTVAEVANRIGVTVSHLSHIEAGRVKISVPMLFDICNALDTDANTLLGMDSRSLLEKRIDELDPKNAEMARVALEAIVEKIAYVYEGRN